MKTLTLIDVRRSLALHMADYACDVTRAADGYLSLQCTHLHSGDCVTVAGIQWHYFRSDETARAFGQVMRDEFALIVNNFQRACA